MLTVDSYIKELADRLNLLEGAVQTGEVYDGPPNMSPIASASGNSRKRTYSAASPDMNGRGAKTQDFMSFSNQCVQLLHGVV
jgi:hypothetical protein